MGRLKRTVGCLKAGLDGLNLNGIDLFKALRVFSEFSPPLVPVLLKELEFVAHINLFEDNLFFEMAVSRQMTKKANLKSARWRNVSLGTSVTEKSIPALYDGRSFPLLETMAIMHDVSLRENHPNYTFSTKLLDSAPFITHLEVDSLGHFHLDNSAIQVLNRFPNLRSLVYDLKHHWAVPFSVTPLQQSNFLHLTELEFRLMFAALIDGSTLPALTRLTITNNGLSYNLRFFRAPWPSEKISRFFERSRCSLKILHLDYIPLSDGDLLSLLKVNPALEELRVKEVNREEYTDYFRLQDTITPSLLMALCVSSALSPPLVPGLEKLADGNLFDDDLTLEMVVSRSWMSKKGKGIALASESQKALKSVTSICVLGRALRTGVKSRLKRLRKKGLRFDYGSAGAREGSGSTTSYTS
ncbi:hypothetical protein D9758_001541 [Tetrapyrgos nigripes]|uniref:Uncharacterized protein n=1 Tax=Tetrapyrgos nigripes TaxID=182062 RepID=A0A8H5GXL8_9AGAR|nr:hypothetical protein D9758_001541 [Tetrapyrgos nigripes]